MRVSWHDGGGGLLRSFFTPVSIFLLIRSASMCAFERGARKLRRAVLMIKRCIDALKCHPH